MSGQLVKVKHVVVDGTGSLCLDSSESAACAAEGFFSTVACCTCLLVLGQGCLCDV